MKDYRSTALGVDFSIIRDNARAIRRALPEKTRLCAVVKANAYGHGDIECARAALDGGASLLAVAFAQEGIKLREHDITAPILVMGSPEQDAGAGSIEEAVAYGLTLTAFHSDHLYYIDKFASETGKQADVHIKVDTGMSRIGIYPSELFTFVSSLENYRNIRLSGIYTHLSSADSFTRDDEEFTRQQFEAFMEAALPIKVKCPDIILHAANSAAALRGISSLKNAADEALYPAVLLDMARVGIALYGAPPVPTSLPLRQAMRWSTKISMVNS